MVLTMHSAVSTASPFGLRRTFHRRYWTSSLRVNGTFHDAYRQLEGVNATLKGWTIEFWLNAIQLGVKPLAGTVLFEFRDSKVPCGSPHCKEGDDPQYQYLSPGFSYSLMLVASEGFLQLVGEIKSNRSSSGTVVNNIDVGPIMESLGTLETNAPHHIAITVRWLP
jgi:hypothetical protein